MVEVLLGSGKALSGTKTVVKFWGTPEAISAVSVTEYMKGEAITVTTDLPVKVDDLVPLENQKSSEKVDKNASLLSGYQPQRPRAPAFEHEVAASMLLLSLLKYISQTPACARGGKVDDSVEVVYIPRAAEKDKESGQGCFQARAKRKITLGGIRLLPIGGTILIENIGTERSSIEKQQNLLPCYFRWVRGTCALRREVVHVEYKYVYSLLGYEPERFGSG